MAAILLRERGGSGTPDRPFVAFGARRPMCFNRAMVAAPSVASPFRRVALVGRYASPEIAAPLARLAAFLAARGHAVVLEAETARFTPVPGYPTADAGSLGAQSDVAIVVGGDGTMLAIARQLARSGVPLIGVNQGRLGFLTDIPLATMEEALAAMLGGAYIEERRSLLVAEVA